jgi:hypothetical protein
MCLLVHGFDQHCAFLSVRLRTLVYHASPSPSPQSTATVTPIGQSECFGGMNSLTRSYYFEEADLVTETEIYITYVL